MPAMSSPVLNVLPDSARFQSLGLEPETTTLIATSLLPGEGMGESMILTLGPLWTIASFMLAGMCLVRLRVLVARESAIAMMKE